MNDSFMIIGENSPQLSNYKQKICELQKKIINAKTEKERSGIINQILKIKEHLRKNGY